MTSIREHILNELKTAEGAWVSGELLRQNHDVSRMAISKQVRSLIHLGYDIESSTRKGYRLLFEPDLLRPEAVTHLLESELFHRDRYNFVEETKSTNDDIKKLALENAPEGTVLVAEAQKRGRGRRGRSWFGQHGNSLLLSVLVRPQIEPQHWAMLPLMTAVATREALAEFGIHAAQIKWPNDILVNGRKIAGILCEISTEMDRLEYAVLGIGLNVNTPAKALPAEISEIACSMYALTNKRYKRAEVLARILHHLEHWLRLSMDDGFEAVRQRWTETNCTLGNEVEITDPHQHTIRGTAIGILETGALRVRENTGEERKVYGGDLSFPDQ